MPVDDKETIYQKARGIPSPELYGIDKKMRSGSQWEQPDPHNPRLHNSKPRIWKEKKEKKENLHM